MPCYFYMNGQKQNMDEEVFDEMLQALHQPKTLETSIPTSLETNVKPSRWNSDGTYNKKPLEPEYFTKYYKHKLSTPFKCPDCGRTLRSKSNLSHHRKTNICIKNRMEL